MYGKRCPQVVRGGQCRSTDVIMFECVCRSHADVSSGIGHDADARVASLGWVLWRPSVGVGVGNDLSSRREQRLMRLNDIAGQLVDAIDLAVGVEACGGAVFVGDQGFEAVCATDLNGNTADQCALARRRQHLEFSQAVPRLDPRLGRDLRQIEQVL